MYFNIVTWFDQSSFSHLSFSRAQGAQSSCCLHFDLSLHKFECVICFWQTKLTSVRHSSEPQVSHYSKALFKLFNYLKLNISCFYVHRYFKTACIFCNQDVQTARAERKMYVWTCTKENLSCNLPCYNVQYVCIVFDWGNFYAERNLCWFFLLFFLRLHFWSTPLLCNPRALLFVQPPCHSLGWNNWQMCSHAVCVWFDSAVWLILGGGHNMVDQLN